MAEYNVAGVTRDQRSQSFADRMAAMKVQVLQPHKAVSNPTYESKKDNPRVNSAYDDSLAGNYRDDGDTYLLAGESHELGPDNYITADDIKPPNYIHGMITRQEAETLLQKHGLIEGMYLIRGKADNPNASALSMVVNGQFAHHLIENINGTYYFNGKPPTAKSLAELISILHTATADFPFPCTRPLTVEDARNPNPVIQKKGTLPAKKKAPVVPIPHGPRWDNDVSYECLWEAHTDDLYIEAPRSTKPAAPISDEVDGGYLEPAPKPQHKPVYSSDSF